MKLFIHILLRLLLLPVFVLLIAPLGLLLRAVADPMHLKRNSRPSMLRMAKTPAATVRRSPAVPATRNA